MSDKLRAAALAALDWLKDKRLDTWQYMEGSQFYADRDKQVKALEAALAEPAIKESLIAQRPWVGLTDEEVNSIYETIEKVVGDHWENGGTKLMFPVTLYEALEAKLREKKLMTKKHRQEALAQEAREKVRKPLTEDDDLDNVRYKAKYRYETKQPLTDAEIYECYRSKFDIMLTDSGAQNTIKQFARAVEQAHGIGVEDDK